MLHAMIMAGGGGTRFWPRSRQRAAQAVPHPRRRPHAAAAGARPHRGAGAAGAHLGHHRRAASRRSRSASSPSMPGRARRRRAVRPRHRRLHRPGRGPDRPRGPRRGHAGHAGRPRHRAGPGVSPRRPRRRAAGRGAARRAGHLRHPADLPRHRLRLHPARRRSCRAGRASASSSVQAFREKPAAGPGRAVRRVRRILLEQRHLRLEGGTRSWTSCANGSRSCTPPCERIADAWDTPQRERGAFAGSTKGSTGSASTTP